MNEQERQQRQAKAVQLSRNRQERGLLERMAQRAVVRQQQAELAKAEQRQQRQGK